MKTLFLDDMEDRHTLFVKLYGNQKTTFVKTAEEAIAALSAQKFNLVSLDHDLGGPLGGKMYQPSESKYSGMEVVRWIIKNEPKIKLIIIHSWNIPASIRMADDLHRAGYNVERKPLGFGTVSFQRAIRRK